VIGLKAKRLFSFLKIFIFLIVICSCASRGQMIIKQRIPEPQRKLKCRVDIVGPEKYLGYRSGFSGRPLQQPFSDLIKNAFQDHKKFLTVVKGYSDVDLVIRCKLISLGTYQEKMSGKP